MNILPKNAPQRFASILLVILAMSTVGYAQDEVPTDDVPLRSSLRNSVPSSNWVDFRDATSETLMFNPGDKQEKDMVAGDVDRDGDMDILIARKAPYSNRGACKNFLLINEGGRLFNRTSEHIPGFMTADDARDIALFDANNDGWLDIVVVTTSGEQPRLFINKASGIDPEATDKDQKIWLGFEESENWFTPVFNPGPKFRAVAVGDVTGDTFADLYFVDYNNSLEDRLLVNDGSGKFVDETLLRLTPEMAESNFGTQAIIADWNRDGFSDILKLTTTSGAEDNGRPEAIRLLINNPENEGHFSSFQDLPFHETYTVEGADFNNDGRMDLYAVSDNVDYVIWNNSSNTDGTINVTMKSVVSDRRESYGGNTHAWDIDGDGLRDVGVSGKRVAFLQNKAGDRLFDPNTDVALEWNLLRAHDFCWIDINNDGMIDVFMGTATGYKMFVQDPTEPGDKPATNESKK